MLYKSTKKTYKIAEFNKKSINLHRIVKPKIIERQCQTFQKK